MCRGEADDEDTCDGPINQALYMFTGYPSSEWAGLPLSVGQYFLKVVLRQLMREIGPKILATPVSVLPGLVIETHLAFFHFRENTQSRRRLVNRKGSRLGDAWDLAPTLGYYTFSIPVDEMGLLVWRAVLNSLLITGCKEP